MKKQSGRRKTSSIAEHPAVSTPMFAAAAVEDLPVDMRQRLIDLAEELGRMMGRRESETLRNSRRGYSLIEMLLGAAIIAAVVLLTYRALR